jgi:hypothetical protein
MKVVYNDGGRKKAGYKGSTGDCVVRAVAIATEQDYQTVYDALTTLERSRRKSKHNPRGATTVREGVQTRSKAFKDYMRALGWMWTPTMAIGSGCKVHLATGELPMGRLIVAVSKHYTAVIDGVIYDTHNPQREPQNVYGGNPVIDPDGQRRNPIVQVIGGRCVYGYWSHAKEN